MTLKEAAKHGKWVKRASQMSKQWRNTSHAVFTVEDMEANDWMFRNIYIRISIDRLQDILQQCVGVVDSDRILDEVRRECEFEPIIKTNTEQEEK